MDKKIKISIGILVLVAVIFLVNGGLTGNVVEGVSASQGQVSGANAAVASQDAGSCGGGAGGGSCGSPSCGAATGGSCGGGSGGCGG